MRVASWGAAVRKGGDWTLKACCLLLGLALTYALMGALKPNRALILPQPPAASFGVAVVVRAAPVTPPSGLLAKAVTPVRAQGVVPASKIQSGKAVMDQGHYREDAPDSQRTAAHRAAAVEPIRAQSLETVPSS